ncbi:MULTISPECIES: hypothetical protein, partial [unclassified Phenylobacterium]|uniref:hypothetical protein n=1 Tax=unclassified Phenylobacterium TaxID=2640670 RepID=UPI001E46DA16
FCTPITPRRGCLLHADPHLKAHDYESETMGEVLVSPVGQFTTSAVALIMNLTNRPHYVAKQRHIVGKWPY